jgi:hypothetical protein
MKYLSNLNILYSCYPETSHAGYFNYDVKGYIERITDESSKNNMIFNGGIFPKVNLLIVTALELLIKEIN